MSEGTGGSFLTSGTPAGGQSTPPPDMSTAQGAVDAVIDGPPEWVPPKYWDPEKKAPKVEELGKGYINLEKLLGREKIPMPMGDDDNEGWERVYKAIGRPEKPDDYEFDRPTLPEDLPYDEDMEKNFRTLAHINGWNKKQAKNAYDMYVKTQVERHAAWHNERKQANAKVEQDLRREYGNQYENKITLARAALSEFADPQYIQWLDSSGFGNDQNMIRAWIKVGEKMGGEKRLKGTPVAQANPQDAQRAISEFRSKNQKALFDKTHPDHNRLTAEFTKLFQAAYPDPQGM